MFASHRLLCDTVTVKRSRMNSANQAMLKNHRNNSGRTVADSVVPAQGGAVTSRGCPLYAALSRGYSRDLVAWRIRIVKFSPFIRTETSILLPQLSFCQVGSRRGSWTGQKVVPATLPVLSTIVSVCSTR